MRKSLKLVWDSAPGWSTAGFFVLILEGLLPVASIYMLKLMLDAVSTALLAPHDPTSFQNVVTIIIATGIVALLSNIVHTISGLITQVQNRAVVDHMYDILHAKSLEADLEYYENAKYYDSLHRAQEDATFRPIMILNNLTAILRSGVSLAGLLVLLVTVHWVIIPVLFLAVIPSILVRVRFSRISYNLQRQYTGKERRAWYLHWLMTSIDFAKEIRIYALGNFFHRQYQAIRNELRQLRLKIDLQRSILELAAQIIATLSVYGAYGFIAYRTISGFSTIGALAMFYQAFQRGQGFLQELLGGIASLYENNLFLTNLYEFLNLKQRITDPVSPLKVPSPFQSGILFDHVSFTYPTGDRQVLSDINISVNPGEVIALVGENGSGKTTLVKLLCRLYDPTSGKISLDGINITQFSLNDLREQIGIIFQDYAKYNLSARENIWLGNVKSDTNDQIIKEASIRAGAHEFITELKNGYDTILGKLFENGEELSIGQWQKIALARAFLRDSQIIIMDEPTSALDANAEFQVFAKFKELLQGRTAVLISHRLSTVRMADRIYVMNEGKIVECGNHDQLINLGGIYAHLYNTQAQPYR